MAGTNGQDPPGPQADPPPQGDQTQQTQQTVDTPPAAPPEPPPAADWRDRRIGEQQARLRERNARIAQLEADLAQARGQQPQTNGQQWQPPAPPSVPPGSPGTPPTQPPVPIYQGDIQRQINEAAAQMAANQEFNRRCNEVADAGKRIYPNFEQRVQRLVGLVDVNDTAQAHQYNAFLNAAMETGQAPRLIYDLGGDLNEASRIMAMEPVKMAVELTKLSQRISTTDATGAPRPLTPLATIAQNNRNPIAPDDPDNADNLSTEEWMARRAEQVNSRRQRTLG